MRLNESAQKLNSLLKQVIWWAIYNFQWKNYITSEISSYTLQRYMCQYKYCIYTQMHSFLNQQRTLHNMDFIEIHSMWINTNFHILPFFFSFFFLAASTSASSKPLKIVQIFVLTTYPFKSSLIHRICTCAGFQRHVLLIIIYNKHTVIKRNIQ